LIEGLNSRYRELVDQFKNYTAEQRNVTSVGNAIIAFPISVKPTAITHQNGVKRQLQENHGGQSSDNLGTNKQEKQRCPHCKMRNHTLENCWFQSPEKRPPKRPKIEAYSTFTIVRELPVMQPTGKCPLLGPALLAFDGTVSTFATASDCPYFSAQIWHYIGKNDDGKPSKYSMGTIISKPKSIRLWHRRLGHLGLKRPKT
jgi:hypothetical protein